MIHQDLVDAGEQVGVNRVARLMSKHSIQSKMAKKFVITTDPKNTLQPATDRLKRHFDLVDHEDYRTKNEAKKSLFRFIEIFYNRRRRHSYLDGAFWSFRSPVPV